MGAERKKSDVREVEDADCEFDGETDGSVGGKDVDGSEYVVVGGSEGTGSGC